MTVARKLISISLTALCVGALLLGVAYAGMKHAGFDAEPILSGSMGSAMPVGALAIMEPVPTSSIKVGDVITFHSPADKALITHRVRSIRTTADGRIFRTQGDAVEDADPWRLKADDRDATVGRVVTDVPYAGYALNYAGREDSRLVMVWLLAALLLLYVLRHIWRQRPDDGGAEPGHEVATAR